MDLKDQQQLEGLRSDIDQFCLAEKPDEQQANCLKYQHRVESTGDDIISVQVEQLRSDIDKLSLAETIDQQLTNSSLRWAVQENNVEMIEKLLKNGADPNAANEDGSTLLHVMAANPSQYSTMATFFKIIDEKQMNDDAQKRINGTPLRVALKQEYEKIKSLLTECYNPNPKRRYGMIKHSNNSLVDMLFDGKHQLVRLDAQDKSGDTPLHVAVRSRNEEAIDLLLSRGAEPAFRNASGQAALPKIFLNSFKSTDSSTDARPSLNKRAFNNKGDDRFQLPRPLSKRAMHDRRKRDESRSVQQAIPLNLNYDRVISMPRKSARAMYERFRRESPSIQQQELMDLTVRGSRSLHQNNIGQNLNLGLDNHLYKAILSVSSFMQYCNPTGNSVSNEVHNNVWSCNKK